MDASYSPEQDRLQHFCVKYIKYITVFQYTAKCCKGIFVTTIKMCNTYTWQFSLDKKHVQICNLA